MEVTSRPPSVANFGLDAAWLCEGLGFDAQEGIQILQLREAVGGERGLLDGAVGVVIHRSRQRLRL